MINIVVMNPPFGTRRKGVDMDFLSAALKVEECPSVHAYDSLIKT